jgi:hypothetical protein
MEYLQQIRPNQKLWVYLWQCLLTWKIKNVPKNCGAGVAQAV